ncbi:MAG TPA: DPP IV N-terminal domain-containing protein [Bryobacteraceae bacterium]|nr:DPP IV N-terminal domain-containing protein [Bryobacteraceae bacterium]
MKTRMIAVFSVLGAALVCVFLLSAQDVTTITITKGERPSIAVADMRGSGAAQQYMDTFNKTLWDELENSGALRMVPKTSYPLNLPQQPGDFKPPVLFSEWARPPVNTNYLAFGYTAVQDNQILLYGNLFSVGQPDVQSAQVFPTRRYYGPLSSDGAKSVARQFAADILKQFGVMSLSGTKIYFVSDRSGSKEIWSMDYDGSNQRQLTNLKAITNFPAVSADGKLFAFMTFAGGNPQIRIHTTDTSRRQTFVNPVSSTVTTPEFTPDGKSILFAATIDGWLQLMMAGIDGSGMRRLSNVQKIEVSPRVNPKTGSDLLFISGRSGRQQLWHMNLDGTDREMLTTGEGDVSNPSWSPDGHHIVFSWTRGYEPGNFNLFVMDIADRKYVQLTTNSGRNENPTWAPDGLHLVFSSMRGRVTQIYSMLADGTNVRQLTTQGNNLQPVWAKGTE